MAKRKVDTAAVMASPEMQKAMRSSAKTLADMPKYRGKGEVTGGKPPAGGAAPRVRKAGWMKDLEENLGGEAVRSAKQIARGLDVGRQSRRRARYTNRVIEEIR